MATTTLDEEISSLPEGVEKQLLFVYEDDDWVKRAIGMLRRTEIAQARMRHLRQQIQ